MKEEKGLEILLPEDLAFENEYRSCVDCYFMHSGKHDQIWCVWYKSYYQPSKANECFMYRNDFENGHKGRMF